MARKKSRTRGDGSNPNTVLVVFMVFFILLSIGLGVTTYYGYAGQKKLLEDATTARNNEKAAREAQDYFKFQALLARAAEGPLVKDESTDEYNDLDVFLTGFEDGSRFQKEKTRPALEELVKKMKDELGWNAGEKRFQTTWADKYRKLDADLKKVQADYGTLMADKKETEKKLNDLQTRYDKYWADMKKAIESGNADTLKAARQRTAEMDKAFARNEDLVKQVEEKDTALQKANRLSQKTLLEKDAEIKSLGQKLAELEKQNQELRAQEAIKTSSLMPGDFAGKWSGSLPRGGTVDVEVKSDGQVVWSIPGAGANVAGVSRIEKSGENYVVHIQNQEVRLYLSSDRRTLRLAGGNLATTLNRKS